jgi:hypothetical protein
MLDSLADRDDLTLVLGAGASRDAGLPDWRSLLRDLLRQGFEMDDNLRNDAADRADRVLVQATTTECATLARLLLGINTNQAIRTALYAQYGSNKVAPGFVMQKAAELAATYSEARLITTNWDDLAESALEDIGVDCRPIGPSGEMAPGAGTQLVHHVHGFVPQTGDVLGPVVFDERDYALLPAQALDPLNEALARDGTLLVGASMTGSKRRKCRIPQREGKVGAVRSDEVRALRRRDHG